jgi:hypothetical protein
MTKPKIGDIWRYPFLWDREQQAGEDEGRKPRNTALAAVVPVSEKSTHLYLLAITGTEPRRDQDALEIPAMEIRRARMTEYKRLWIILDEYNRDELHKSYYFEPNNQVGAFSRAFVKVMSARFATAIRNRSSKAVDRR